MPPWLPILILLNAFAAGVAAGILWERKPARRRRRRKRPLSKRLRSWASRLRRRKPPQCPACWHFIGTRAVHICPKS